MLALAGLFRSEGKVELAFASSTKPAPDAVERDFHETLKLLLSHSVRALQIARSCVNVSACNSVRLSRVQLLRLAIFQSHVCQSMGSEMSIYEENKCVCVCVL